MLIYLFLVQLDRNLQRKRIENDKNIEIDD
jgi:hypothetical protein